VSNTLFKGKDRVLHHDI